MDGSQITSTGRVFYFPAHGLQTADGFACSERVAEEKKKKKKKKKTRKSHLLSVATGRLSPERRGTSRRSLTSKSPKNRSVNEPRSTDRNR